MKKIEQIKGRISGYFDIISAEQTPLSAKILLIAAIVYFLSPIDLIPDFIPVIGYLDDLIIVPTLIWLAFWRIEVAKADRLTEQKKTMSVGTIEPQQCETLP